MSKPEIILNEYGKIVYDEWMRTVLIRKEIEIGEFIVMPNHFHGIVFIHGKDDRLVPQLPMIKDNIQGRPPISGQTNHIRQDSRMIGAAGTPTDERPGPKPKSISSFLAGFKSIATKRINELRQTPDAPIWQRNYYERIIRNEIEYNRICEYIIGNPINWNNDENNPDNIDFKGFKD